MYRVITKYRDQGGARPIVEQGPWHASLDTAEYWAELLGGQGYTTSIESQNGMVQGHSVDADSQLMDALASMA